MEAEAHPSTAGPGRTWAAAVQALAARHALALIVAAGAAIRFATLGSQGFWYDEHGAIVVITQQPSGMLQTILTSETSPPLYFMVAWAWKAVFGLGEVGLRSLSALFGTATIPVAYAAARSLASRRAGLLAAALTATSPFLIWYSQEARPYALFTFLSALAFLFFVHALQEEDSHWLWAWALTSILAFSTHYFGFLLTAFEGLWLLWRLRGRRGEVALAIAAMAGAGVTLILLSLPQRYITSWILGVPEGQRVLQIPQQFVVGLNSPWRVLPPLAVAAVGLLAAYGIARADRRTLRAAAIPAALVAVAVAVPVVAMLAGRDYLITRNLIGVWVPFATALAAILVAPRVRRVGVVAAVGLCAVGLALAVWNAATPAAGRPDWEPVAAALAPADATRVIEYPGAFGWVIPLDRHLPDAHDAHAGERVAAREIDVIRPRPVPDYSIGPCWWVGFCGGKNMLPPDGQLPLRVPRSFKLVAHGEASLFTYRRYRAPRAVKLPPAPAGIFSSFIVQDPS